MTSPYRDALPPADDEPMPQFRPKPHHARYLLGRSALTLALAFLCTRLGDDAGAAKLVILWFPPAALAGIILILQPPIGAWLARRYARAVARGVADLEARAARLR